MTLDLGDLRVDLDGRSVRSADGRVETLTGQEVALLRFLAENAGQTVSREQLFVEVLGYSARTAIRSRALDATVRRLRKKLEGGADHPTHLHTDHGRGFRLEGLRSSGSVAEIAPPSDRSFGHDATLAAVRAEVGNPGVVVTLIGPGGVGKSRLARSIASAGTRPWAWVRVGDGDTEDAVASGIAAALALPASVRRLSTLIHAARSVPLAGVVLDGAEVALDAVAGVAASWVEGLRDRPLVVTSRVPLAIGAERRIAVEPLSEAEAVALLLDRARLALGGRPWTEPDNPGVRELVHRLDGLPLALELAAARARLFGPSELCDRLHELSALRAEQRDIDPRHASLERMIEGSWSLLTDNERAGLSALAVFLGPFPVEAAALVAGSEGIVDSLVRQNLLRPRSADGRLMLFDTVRVFVAAQPSSAAHRSEVDRRLARGAGIEGLTPRDGLHAARLALRFRLPSSVDAVIQVVSPAPSSDAPLPVRERLALASDLFADGVPSTARPGALRVAVAASDLAVLESDSDQVDTWIGRVDATAAEDPVRAAIAAAGLAAAAGRAAEAWARCEPWCGAPGAEGLYATLVGAGGLARMGRLDHAASLLQPIVDQPICRESPSSFAIPSGAVLKAKCEFLLGTVRMNQGRHDEAQRLFERALRRFQSEGELRGIASVLGNMGGLEHRRGRLAEAARAYRIAIRRGRAVGDERLCGSCAVNLALIAVVRGDEDADERLIDAVELNRDVHAEQQLLIARANQYGLSTTTAPEEASAELERTAERAEELGLDDVASMAYLMRAQRLATVDAPLAIEAAERAVERAATVLRRAQALAFRAKLTAAIWPERAMTDLGRLDEFDNESVVGMFRAELDLTRCEALLALGLPEEAGPRLPQIEGVLVDLRLPRESPLVQRATALRASTAGLLLVHRVAE